MSLILDALHKADRERQNNESAPGIDAQHAPITLPNEARSRWVYLGVSVTFIVLVFLLVVVYKQSVANSDSAPSKVTSSDNTAQLVAKTKPVNEHKNTVAVATKDITSEVKIHEAKNPLKPTHAKTAIARRIAAQYDNLAIESEVESETTKSSTKSLNPVATLYEKKQPSTVELVSRKPTKKARNTLTQYPNLGVIRDLPLSVQNSIPTFMYGAHEYIATGKGYILINNQKITQGEVIAGKCVLEKILLDGIIVTVGQHRFTLKALNSWVNM